MNIKSAREIAERVRKIYLPYCERAAIAGSIRRECANVNDIEIVVEPRRAIYKDLFQVEHTKQESLLIALDEMITEGAQVLKRGPRYIQFRLVQGIKLDLFVVRPPAQWGVIMTIRTGSAAFSKWIVTPRRKGGALPSNMRIKSGALWIGNGPDQKIELDSEREFFKAIGLEWIPPAERQGKPGSPRGDWYG